MQGIATRRCQAWEKSIPTVEIWGKKLCLVIQAQNAAVNTSVKAFGWVKWVKGTCHPVPKQNCHKLHRQWSNSREKRTFICYNHMFIWALKHYPQSTFCFFLWENRQSIQATYHYICFSIAYRLYGCSLALQLWLIQHPYSPLDWAGNVCVKDWSPHQCRIKPAFHSTFTHSHVLIK